MADRRKYKRFISKSPLPGKLVHLNNGIEHEILNCEVLSVSIKGLGLLMDSSVPAGTRLQLKLDKGILLVLEVVYSNPEPGRSSPKFYIGAFARNSDINLIKTLSQYGVEISDESALYPKAS